MLSRHNSPQVLLPADVALLTNGPAYNAELAAFLGSATLEQRLSNDAARLVIVPVDVGLDVAIDTEGDFGRPRDTGLVYTTIGLQHRHDAFHSIDSIARDLRAENAERITIEHYE